MDNSNSSNEDGLPTDPMVKNKYDTDNTTGRTYDTHNATERTYDPTNLQNVVHYKTRQDAVQQNVYTTQQSYTT